MIIVTGAAGFIGSCLVRKLNDEGFNYLVLSDNFLDEKKNRNLANKQFSEKVNRKDLMSWIEQNYQSVDFVFHIGARTDTAEFDTIIFDELNLNEIYAAYKVGNEASKKVLEKSGFQFYREKQEFDSVLEKNEQLIEMVIRK